MSLKENIYARLCHLVDAKILSLEDMLRELGEGAQNETKSSAGDKHETARAMAQIEQENLGKQLNEATEQRTMLEKIDISIHSHQIIKGSLVKTNKGDFFLSIGFGKITGTESPVIAISPQSPLGAKLIGLKTGDSAEINGMIYSIESIL